MIMMWLVMN